MIDLTVVAVGAIAGASGLGLFVLSIRRPFLGCAALALTVPLTAGLARGAVIPALKPSEAILLIVALGALIHQLTTRQSRPVSGADIMVAAYVIGSIVIPWAVLSLAKYPATLDTWRTVLSPALFLVVYYLFSRTAMTEAELRIVLNCVLAGGVLVSIFAAAELLDVPGVRSFFATVYTTSGSSPYRPDSTLGHYSAVGGLGLLTFILGLALSTSRNTGFSGWWLTLVMAASLMGLLASETWAPLALLPVATVLIVVYAKRIPGELVATLACGAGALVILWPLISTRADAQQLFTLQGLGLPETMQTRIRYWNEFILPALSNNVWLGTGTVIPSTVPDRLTSFVDNEYLWAGFRAGLPGIALLVSMLVTIIFIGWRQRFTEQPLRRAIGAAATATAAMMLLLGATSQYITFAGLSQEIALVVGTLAALTYPLRDPIKLLPPLRPAAETRLALR